MRMCVKKHLVSLVVVLVLIMPAVGRAASTGDYANLKKEVEELRKKLSGNGAPKVSGPIGKASASVANKYGPNAPVTTKTGKLQIGGLLQVWAYSIQNDNDGAFSLLNYRFNDTTQAPGNPFGYPGHPAAGFQPSTVNGWNTNEINDNDGVRIRRAEIKFSMDINDDITAVVMVDPTGGDEGNTYPSLPSNQGIVSRSALGAPGEIDLASADDAIYNALYSNILAASVGGLQRRRMQQGFMKANRVLQDAYINYHPAWIPHHDFTIGQFKPPMSEEGNRNSGQLDFVERAMINQFSNQRDLGVMVHGTWFDNRLQYWIGAFNTAGSFHNTFASFQNRSDDNDEKDLAWRILGRPIWNHEKWGSLEVGYSRQDGIHGESGNGIVLINGAPNAARFGTDGLSLLHARASRQYAWAWYRPGGPVKGWWLRGEWASMGDRPQPGLWNVGAPQLRPNPYDRSGWYFSTGYKLSDSVWANTLKNHSNFLIKMAHDVEFAYRYEVFGNLVVDAQAGDFTVDAVLLGSGLYYLPKDTQVFKTQVHTAGINYYWKSYNVRTQINYMWVDEPQGHVAHTRVTNPNGQLLGTIPAIQGRRFREVNNNVFIISHQIMW